ELPFLGHELPDEPSDHFVRAPERQAAPHQVVGHIGRQQPAPRRARPPPALGSRSSVSPLMTARTVARQPASVSSASKIASLSSCRSLLYPLGSPFMVVRRALTLQMG